MDTISRENNSLLPMGGVIIGAVALIIGGYAAISLSKVNRTLNAQTDKIAKIDDIASQVGSAAAASDKASRDITTLQNSTQAAVNQLGTELATLDEKMKHIEEAHVTKAAARGAKGAAGGGEPAVAGPGEYIVKSGDTGAKIARANGCTLSDLESVNAGVNWTHLKVGEKLKLPEKK
jgi:LysM repeat protein